MAVGQPSDSTTGRGNPRPSGRSRPSYKIRTGLSRREKRCREDPEQECGGDDQKDRQRGDGRSPLIGRMVDRLKTERAQIQAVQAEQDVQERQPTQYLHGKSVTYHPEGAFETGVVGANEELDEQMVDAGEYHKSDHAGDEPRDRR